jgi:hypothetical protein
MAQYKAVISTPRGEVTRLGHKSTGLRVELRGWTAGVEVIARFDPAMGRDVFEVYRTSGSATLPATEHIATIEGTIEG